MQMADSTIATVGVIGIGNRLMKDEGLGVEALRRLRGRSLQGAELIDGGTDPWSALEAAAGCGSLVVVDAVLGGEPAGTIYRLSLEEVEGDGAVMSLHGITLYHLVQYERLLGNTFGEVRVVGMEPAAVEPGIGLSDVCAERMDGFLEAIEEEIDKVKDRLCAGQGGS